MTRTELRDTAEARKVEVRAYCEAKIAPVVARLDAEKAASTRTRFAAALEEVMDRMPWSTLVRDTSDEDFFALAMDGYRAALRA